MSKSVARRVSDWLLVLSLFVIMNGCAGNGCGCNFDELPSGGLPSDQTLEGGAQMRVTPAGLDKIEQVADDVINDALAGGMCVPEGSQGILIGDIEWCMNNDGSCVNGCDVDFNVDSITLTPETSTLRLRTQFDVQVDVPVLFDPIIGGDVGPCTLDVTINNTVVDARVRLGINSGTGELQITLDSIPNLSLDPDIDGCGFVGDVIDFIADVIADAIGIDFIRELLTPLLNDLLQGLLPDPLGLEGVVDVAGLFGGVAPGTRAALELRVVPGGYAFVERGGLSLGVITGMNADEDPATRSEALDSEPALCVPPLPAPDFAAPPASLSKSSRGNFNLLPAGEFRGLPTDQPGRDVVMGMSETFLDLTGHHAVTSGAMCLGLGTELVPQLNLGAIGLVVPSLAELGGPTGDEPLLLVTRPQRAVDFEIGDGTDASPSLTIHIQDFEIDFYAFLFERYVRAFSVGLDLDVGVNLEFTTDAEGNPALMPILVGLDADNIGITVLNEEFLREDKATLESVLPAILDLALPLIADGLPPVTLPEFAGFRLDDLELTKVTTAEDDFLAIGANLGPSTTLALLSQRFPSLKRSFPEIDQPPARRARAAGARLVRVTTPAPEQIRAALRGDGGGMPEVVIDVPATDAGGRPLEWTWNLEGGLWRPFQPGGQLVLQDGAFAIQGRYQIELRSRVVGDYRTMSSASQVIPVVIDSAPPRIMVEEMTVDGGVVAVPAIDFITPRERVEIAFGRVDDEGPATPWAPGATTSVTEAAELAAPYGMLKVYARDEMGNESSTVLDLDGVLAFHGQGNKGCDCSASGGDGSSTLLVVLAALVGLGGRRRRRRITAWLRGERVARIARGGLLVIGVAVLASQGACSCGDPDNSCKLDEDCTGFCEDQIPICIDGTCACQSEVAWGRIGQYSEMDVAGDTIWVSAYNAIHGDLMVASTTEGGRIPNESWTFVDGVPDGPVVIPGGTVRGGINDPGPDVGLYTDIAARTDGAVMVSYHDRDTASLKMAALRGGSWAIHVIDEGLAGGPDDTYELVGQYSSIAMTSDGRPGVAYFAHIDDGAGARTELRFAEATSADPASGGDWVITVADSAMVPEGAEESDPLPIPVGVGLFVYAVRMADGTPVLVYYDRIGGDLKVVRWDAGTSAFAAPEILDGDGIDVGWYPGVAVDSNDQLHVSYVSASNDDLLYINTIDRTPELVDDGYRLVGTTEDGLPKPEFHFVGDDSTLALTAGGPYIAYQDATSHEILLAHKDGEGNWIHDTLAGNEEPFAGGYGFYISGKPVEGDLVMSTWVLDQPNSDSWVEILRETISVE
jgi:MYXO-CTERM domain-containing protein